ncbi:phosphatase PAP2 family protein [Elongatibacter sediminis]|uniref:Phosphatase PAP2 family protein n=1 Tax=Elongatibacter sediminis TaxID=3119006 RepID=A0AAW9RF66_9GAMM
MAFHPTAGFWVRHLVIPLLCAAIVLSMLEQTSFDLWLADRWYALEGGAWAWRNHWLTYDIIHHRGKQMVIGFGLLILLVTGLTFRVDRIAHWRMPLAYLFCSMAVVPALIAWSKHYSGVPCPWHLERYGGTEVYRHNLEYAVGAAQGGHCFPAGHASGGFALLALYFAVLPFARKPLIALIPGLVVGTVFALGQQARGAHFISHDLWTLSLCWFGALALFFAFRPWRWPRPAGTHDTTRDARP